MNMISTGAFLNEMDASNKQPSTAEKFAAVWEKKNAKAARAGGVSLMALSLAACGGSSSTTTTSTSTDTSSTTTTTTTPVSSSLTIASDTVTGSTGADTVSGGRVDGIQTLNTGDNIDLGAGADTLTATLNAGSIAPTVANVETLTFSAVGAATVDFDNASGYTTLVNTGSTAALTLDDVASVAGIKVTNTAQNTTVTFKTAALSGTADAVTITLEDVTTGGTLTVGSEADADGAIETLNIVSNGVANTTTLAAGTTATTVTVTGAGDLDIDASNLFAALTSFDASAATGDVKVAFADKTTTSDSLDISISTGSGNDQVDIDQIANADVDNVTLSLGAGNDTLIVSDQDTDTGSTYAAGDGTDTLRVDAAITAAAYAGRISGFEVLQFSTTANSLAQDMDLADGMNIVSIFNSLHTTGDLTINDAVSGIEVRVDGTAVDNASAGDDIDTLAVNIKTDGATDSMTLKLTGTSAGETLRIDDFQPDTEFETVTITSGGAGTNIIDTIGTAKSNLVIDGARPLTLTATGSLTGVLDATAMTGALTITDTADDSALTINSGSGNDSITIDDDTTVNITIRTGAGNDTINGGDTDNNSASVFTVDAGAGNDTIDFTDVDGSTTTSNTVTTELTGGDGVDIITLGGAAADGLVLNDHNISALTSDDMDHVTGFITTKDDIDYNGALLNDAATTVVTTSGGTLTAALANDADATVYGVTNNLTGAASTELTALANATTVAGITKEAGDFEAALATALGTVTGLDSTLGTSEAVLMIFDDGTDSVLVRVTNSDTSTANTLTAAEIEVVAVYEDEIIVAADVI